MSEGHFVKGFVYSADGHVLFGVVREINIIYTSCIYIYTSCIYFLPKFHKPNNPGRLIVSACSCPTELISSYFTGL